MENKNLVTVEQFCTSYNIEVAFINSLTESGLVEIMTVETTPCINMEQIRELERLIHLHELDINMEGIEAIHHLLQRVDRLQAELTTLRNRLRFYEPEGG